MLSRALALVARDAALASPAAGRNSVECRAWRERGYGAYAIPAPQDEELPKSARPVEGQPVY